MQVIASKKLFLPARDRSFWKCPDAQKLPLLYLAWGHRDFQKQPVPASQHEGWCCLLIEEGLPTLKIEGRPVRISAGTLAVLGPDCEFGWEATPSGECKFLLWMWRDLEDVSRAYGESAYIIRILNRKMQSPLLRLHEACRDEILRADAISARYLTGCHLQFQAILERSLQAETEKDSTRLRSQIIDWMTQHLDSREPVARLCDYLNLSQSTLYRLFRDEYGVSPLAYFNQLKMEQARQFLRESRLTVKEVAHALGYRYFNDFSRAYKKYHGRTPLGERDAAQRAKPKSK